MKQGYKELIVNKLAQMNCASLDPEEIKRCFSGCCSPTKLTATAMSMTKSGALTMKDIEAVK